MQQNTDHIQTTHVGSLVRPPELVEFMRARLAGEDYDEEEFRERLVVAIQDVVGRQAAIGIDIVSDGEYGNLQGRSRATAITTTHTTSLTALSTARCYADRRSTTPSGLNERIRALLRDRQHRQPRLVQFGTFIAASNPVGKTYWMEFRRIFH